MSKNKTSNGLERFFAGRNGMDQLNVLFLICYCIFALVGTYLESVILTAIGLVFLIIVIWRMLSKKLDKRSAANAKLTNFFAKRKAGFHYEQQKWKDRNTHVYKKCPTCKKVLRVKRRKGVKTVNCPHCGTQVTFKIRRKGELDKLEEQQQKAEKKVAEAENKNS